MKFNILCILLTFIVNGCELFQTNGETDYGHCSKELYEQVRERGTVRVMAEYDMEYTSETQLNEEEREAQRTAIAEMHQQLLEEMEGLNISGVSKLKISPFIAMSLNDEKALRFLCQSELVKKVTLNNTGTIH